MKTFDINLFYLYQEYIDNGEEYLNIDEGTCFIGKSLSEISLDIPFQDFKAFLNKNFEKLDETEEETREREAREEEARLSIAKYEQEHEARVQALMKKHRPKRGRPRKKKTTWNGEYRIDYPCSRA